MLRPSASMTNSSATSTMRTHVRPSVASTTKGSTIKTAATAAYSTKCLSALESAVTRHPSRSFRHLLPHQSRRPQHEHADEHQEGEDVAVVAAEHASREIADVARGKAFDDAE